MKTPRRFLAKNYVRSIAFCFAALFAVIAGTPANAQSITLVQHAGKDAGTSTSSTLAFPSANTAGNWIAVVIRAGALNETITVSDSRNSYKKALQFNQTVDGFTAAIFYAENISGGANTVTVSDSISGTLRFAIYEYSGVATVNSLDVIATAQGSSTTPSTAAGVNTTANGDLLLGTIMTGNGRSFTAGSGYKIEDSVPALPNAKLIVEDQIQASAGATLANATMNTADDWGAAFAAFKAANGTGGTAPTISNLNPNSGGVGTPVIITGTNFLATQAQGNSTVKFNGVQTIPTAWSTTSITAPVPTGATTGNVVVTVNGVNSNGVLFTVPAPPSVTINQASGQADPTNGSTINFTAVFSTAVTGFSNSGVNLSGTAGATTAVVTGSGTTYNVAVSGMTQTGTVTATIPAGAASANGMGNTASTSTDNTVTYDITPPSVTVNQAASQADPAGNSPVNFTAGFSEAVTGFSNSGVTLGGTAGATTAVVTGSGTTYNIAVSGMTQTGTVIVSIPAGKATDLAGNPNTASTSTDNTVTFNFTALAGPVAAYSFEEGQGTTTADSSGNNNNGTLSTGVTWTAGKSGNAVLFNGTSGDITVPDSNSLDLNGSFTISAWVKPTTVSGIQTLLIKETTSGCSYFLQINNGQIDGGFNNGSGCVEHITSTANLTAGNWYFIAIVLDHSVNTYSTYLNGTLISSVNETGVPLPNSQPLVIGRSACGGCGFERLNGVLDEVRIYNRAQSASEVQSIYNSYIGGPTIASLNPTSGTSGTPVTISGTNFGSTQTQGNSTVKFNGVQTTPTAWGPTSITAPAPAGVTTGNVIVNVNGVNSNGVLFTSTNQVVTVTVSPKRAAITTGQTQTFAATVTGSADTSVTWEVDTFPGGNAAVGTISAAGVYTPPATGGVHSVVARSHANTTVTSPASSVAVTDLAGVFTYHNDNARDGVNAKEYALTTSTVNSTSFGKLFSCGMDGAVYAQPLWVANFNINGGVHNVILAVSMRDTVYLFDADANPCVTYWSQSLLPPGETYVSNADVNTFDIFPDIGILGTPVIDPSTNAVYLVAKSKTTSGTATFKQRLYALNLVDGSERTNSPLDLTPAITFPGNADMGSATCPNTGGATPSVTFCPLRQNQRPGVALDNGVVYVAWASHGDKQPYHGWVLGFDAATLVQTGSFNTSPNGREGGIWMSGGAPAIDASHNLYVISGNGDWDGVTEFGDSVVKLNGSALTLNNWFTPAGQASLDSNDLDFGSGGAVVLVDVPTAPNPHMLIAGGKGSSFNGELYVLNRDNLGQMTANDTQIIQKIVVGAGLFSTEAYWQNTIYAAGAGTTLKAYTLDTASGLFNTSTVPQAPTVFGFPGTTPSVSSSGSTNGIVWAIQVNNYGTYNGGARTATPAVLHAYDASNIATELWNSSQNAVDTAGIVVKFTVPTIANGKVYIPTRGDDTTTNTPTVRGTIDVYGLKPN